MEGVCGRPHESQLWACSMCVFRRVENEEEKNKNTMKRSFRWECDNDVLLCGFFVVCMPNYLTSLVHCVCTSICVDLTDDDLRPFASRLLCRQTRPSSSGQMLRVSGSYVRTSFFCRTYVFTFVFFICKCSIKKPLRVRVRVSAPCEIGGRVFAAACIRFINTRLRHHRKSIPTRDRTKYGKTLNVRTYV